MTNPPRTYPEILQDIISRLHLSPEDKATPALEHQIRLEQELFTITLSRLCANHGGWMLLTAFAVSFTECKKVMELAEGIEKETIKIMLDTVIGSYGKVVQ